MGCRLNYFVAGLPRSRTAWLSAFLSQSGQYCFHDGFNGCRSMDEYLKKIGDCGDSSTGFGLFNVNELFPDAPVVIIEKNPTELAHCIQWCCETFDSDLTDDILDQHEKLMSLEGMRVKQSEINNKLQDIFEYLTNCEWKIEYNNMVALNIQADHRNIDKHAALELMNARV